MPAPSATALPPHFAREISREEMAELPIRRYEGEVCLVASAADLERAIADVGAEQVLGWDTETRPAFRKGESYPPSLVQLATARTVYIFQLARLDVARPVAGWFAAAGIVKVGISVADDLRSLKRVFDFEERSVLDAGTVARRHGLEQTGLRNLAGIFLGIRIPKGKRTSNWAAPRLTPQQIEYAATDAWACRELYLRFRELGMV